MSKLHFILDKKYDFEEIFYIFSPNDPAGIEDRARGMGIDLEVAKKIQKLGKTRASSLVRRLVNERYKKISFYMRKMRDIYQKSWNQINDQFFMILESRTESKMKYKNYYCVVSAFHPGISSWGGNKIARIWSENPYTMRRITGHELVIPHIFNIFREKLKITGHDWQIWEVAEISAWLILGLEKDFLKFWPWLVEIEKFPLKHNYPQLVKKQLEIKKIYLKNKNFENYLTKSFAYLNSLKREK